MPLTSERLLSSPPTPRGAAAPLHVTIVDEELPFPPNSGKRIRTLNLVRRLAARHRLTLVCHRNTSAAEALEAQDYLAGIDVRTIVVDRAVPARSGPLFCARLAANLLSSLPYSVTTHDSKALRRALRRHAAVHRVDLWQCEWTPYAHLLRQVRGPRVVNAQNVESVIWQRYFETETNSFLRWYIGRQWAKFRRFERRILAGVDQVVAVSDVDADRLRADFAVERVAVVENGVDTGYFRPQGEARDPHRLLFLGSLDWRPNLDGARLLLREIFPAVRAAVPSATLSVVGRNPPIWLHRLAEQSPGVELHADVPDVRTHLAQCGLLVVPLRIGGGSRLKILEALATGTPVVSTTVGVEGLHLEAGHHLLQVDNTANLTPVLIEALRDPERMLQRAAAGRRVVLERYDWDYLADEMEKVWLDCVNPHQPGMPAKGAS